MGVTHERSAPSENLGVVSTPRAVGVEKPEGQELVRMERLLTLAEVAHRFQFKQRWLRQFVRRHRIPVLGSRNQIRFDPAALNSLEEALRLHWRSNSPASEMMSSRSLAGSTYGVPHHNAFELLFKRKNSGSVGTQRHSKRNLLPSRVRVRKYRK